MIIFNDSVTTEIYTLTLHVALPILEMFVVREGSTFTTRVTDLLAPLVIVVRLNRTTPALRQRPPLAETKCVLVGTASVWFTPVASDGTMFVTVSVEEMLVNANTGSG